jgi:hypothetical protein
MSMSPGADSSPWPWAATSGRASSRSAAVAISTTRGRNMYDACNLDPGPGAVPKAARVLER